MKPLLLSARMANVLCIMLFLLPFFRQCDTVATVPDERASAPSGDSLRPQADSSSSIMHGLMNPPYAQQVSATHSSVRWLLMRGKKDYTGLGMVVNGIPLVSYAGCSMVFLLLCMLLGIRLLDREALRSVVLTDLVLGGILFLSRPWWNFEVLWGYWVLFWATTAMLALDGGILWWQWRQKRASVR